MDEEAAIPEWCRFEVLRDIFPTKVLNEILIMMGLEVDPLLVRKDKYFCLNRNVRLSCSSSDEFGCKISVIKDKPEEQQHHEKHHVKFGTVNVKRKIAGKENPYMNFFLRLDREVAIWHKMKRPPFKEMTLAKRAERATEIIAKNFVRWLKQIETQTRKELLQEQQQIMDSASVTNIFEDAFGFTVRERASVVEQTDQRRNTRRLTRMGVGGVQRKKSTDKLKDEKKEKPAFNVSDITHMFDINLYQDPAVSLEVAVKEIPTVTKNVAERCKLPHMSTVAALHRNLANDINYYAKKEKGGSSSSKRRNRNVSERIRKLRGLQHYNENIETMATVWEGITDLKSTQGYCKWLLDHPKIPPPKYLEQMGMLNPEILAKMPASKSQLNMDNKIYENLGLADIRVDVKTDRRDGNRNNDNDSAN